ncbi:VWA domain-containing protein [Tautonia rosea]|uniref:VWA domain-containing protein n=1 Tax=Tautonia rosea TaxID=2728037 RepID=UPI001474B0A1|nr:VWA domain-containing protein [Tautonia rosea]
MTLDLGNGRRLFLAVGDDAWIWITAGAVTLGLLLALSRYERRLVPRHTGWILLALRIAAALALVVALLEPIAARSWTERIEGRLIVGVDVSASMDTTDARRPPDQADLLRNAPGLAPPADDATLPPTRLATASRILRGDALAELDRSFAVEAYRFARSTTPAERDALARSIDSGEPLTDAPDDRLATDWSTVLERALANDTSTPVLGVVLLTDGLRNAPPREVRPRSDALADRLARAGVPVFPVLIGSTIPPRDAAITAIQAPESTFSGDSLSINVEVKADGFGPGADIPVLLDVPGLGTLRQVVPASPDGSRPVASFRVTLEDPGAVELVATVEPPEPPDERPENNRRSATVVVTDEPARVLLVDAEARWEFRYLRAALDRDRRVEVVPILLAPPPPSGASEPTFASALPPAPPEDSGDPDPLTDFEVILLGDLPPSLTSDVFWKRLHAYVSDHGGTLILTSGPRSWPSAWQTNDLARALLPVLNPRLLPIDPLALDPDRATLPPGIPVVPADEAAASPTDWPMLQFAADPAASRAAWQGLAPLTWVLAGQAKPGAVPLLVPDRPDDTSSTDAVMAAHPYGLGKVLWIGTDGTWRWRLRVGDAYHHRFWGQVIRWAAAANPPTGNRLVRFGPDRPTVPSDTPFPLFARFSSDVPNLGPDLIAAARIFHAPPANPDAPPANPNPNSSPPSDPIALVPLHPSPDRPGTFEALSPALPPGRYRALLDAPSLSPFFTSSGLPTPETTFTVSPEPTTELLDLASDPTLLSSLSSTTGGQLLPDFSAGQLPSLLRSQTLSRTLTAETPLWDTPLGLIAFFSLLTAEWLLRKRAGLP